MHLDPNNIKSYSYPTSGTAWNDLSGNQNNATLVNTPTYKNTSGGYFTFNGVDEYASVPHAPNLAPTDAITVCCWARLSNWSDSSVSGTMVSKLSRATLSASYGGYSLSFNKVHGLPTPNVCFFVIPNSDPWGLYNTGDANLKLSSGWHYFVGTYDGRVMRLYVDGVFINYTIFFLNTSIHYEYENNLQIGASAGEGTTPAGDFWPGSIGPVSIYNRVLSDDEIIQNFQAYQRRYIDPDVSQSRLILNLDATNFASYPGTGTSWNDISGNQNDITLHTTTYDATSGSFSFNGTSSYAQRTAITPANFITVDVWVKWTEFGNTSGGYAIVSNAEYDGVGGLLNGYMLYQTTSSPFNKVRWVVTGALGSMAFSSSNLINTGVWYNIVATYDGRKMYLYINGVLDSEATAVLGDIKPTTNSFLVGSTYNSSGSKFKGNISAVKIYSRALSSPEIFQNYQATRRRYELIEYNGPQLVNNGLILNLDAGDPLSYPKTGTSWLDLSGNSNNGTLTNGPVYNKARGGVISFDGVDDVVVTNDTNLRFNTPTFTVCAMFYWNGANTASALVSKRNGATPNQQYTISIAGDIAASTVGNNLQLVAKDDSNSTIVGLQYALPAAGWYYAVGVISTQAQTLYVNGASRASSTVDLTGKTFNIPSKDLCIGAAVNDGGNGYSYFYGGNISRVMIYNRAISADEVTQNFKAVRGRYGL